MKDQEFLTSEKAQYVFNSMIEEVHIWKLIKDENQNIVTWSLTFANKAALTTWEVKTLEEIQYKTTDEIFGEGATQHYLEVVQKVFAERKSHTFQDYFPNINRHFRFTTVPLEDHFITTGWDITDFVEKNESLSDDFSVLQRQIKSKLGLEKQTKEQTQDLETLNIELQANLNNLQEELRKKEFENMDIAVKFSQLVLNQSNLIQKNALMLKQLTKVQKENRELLKLMNESYKSVES